MVSSCTTVMYPEKESDMSFSSEVKEELVITDFTPELLTSYVFESHQPGKTLPDR